MDEWPARSPLAPAAPKATPHDAAHRTGESGSLIEFPILLRIFGRMLRLYHRHCVD